MGTGDNDESHNHTITKQHEGMTNHIFLEPIVALHHDDPMYLRHAAECKGVGQETPRFERGWSLGHADTI